MPAARSQLVTVRRPVANSAPAARAVKRCCWRASRTWASSSSQLDNSCGSGQDVMAGPPRAVDGVTTAIVGGGPALVYPPAVSHRSCETVLGKCSRIGKRTALSCAAGEPSDAQNAWGALTNYLLHWWIMQLSLRLQRPPTSESHGEREGGAGGTQDQRKHNCGRASCTTDCRLRTATPRAFGGQALPTRIPTIMAHLADVLGTFCSSRKVEPIPTSSRKPEGIPTSHRCLPPVPNPA